MRTSYTQGERERERERETEEKEFLSIPPDFDIFICFLLLRCCCVGDAFASQFAFSILFIRFVVVHIDAHMWSKP